MLTASRVRVYLEFALWAKQRAERARTALSLCFTFVFETLSLTFGMGRGLCHAGKCPRTAGILWSAERWHEQASKSEEELVKGIAAKHTLHAKV